MYSRNDLSNLIVSYSGRTQAKLLFELRNLKHYLLPCFYLWSLLLIGTPSKKKISLPSVCFVLLLFWGHLTVLRANFELCIFSGITPGSTLKDILESNLNQMHARHISFLMYFSGPKLYCSYREIYYQFTWQKRQVEL